MNPAGGDVRPAELFAAARAGLDEDERWALLPAGEVPETWAAHFCSTLSEWRVRDCVTGEPRAVATCDSYTINRAQHTARHDPARVMRWVQAMRELVDECESLAGGVERLHDPGLHLAYNILLQVVGRLVRVYEG